MSVPAPTVLFHLTHGANLKNIIAQGGLKSFSLLRSQGINPTTAAYNGIQGRRAKKVVPCPPGGTLHDYVPSYFCSRSPMLYANHRGRVATNPHGQRALIHLVTTVEAVLDAQLDFVFTDGHAAMKFSQFFVSPNELTRLDWNVIQSWHWKT